MFQSHLSQWGLLFVCFQRDECCIHLHVPKFIHWTVLRNDSSSTGGHGLFAGLSEWWIVCVGCLRVHLTIRGSILPISWGYRKGKPQKKNLIASVVNPCTSRNPCLNSGTCFGRYNTNGSLFTQCFCLQGYTGDLCESKNQTNLFDSADSACSPFQQLFAHSRRVMAVSVLQLKTPSFVLVQQEKLAIAVKSDYCSLCSAHPWFRFFSVCWCLCE